MINNNIPFCPYCSIGLDKSQMKNGKCNNCLHEFEIFHVWPVKDLEKHFDTYTCHCKPEIQKEGENIIITHNAFDGREGVEWANEILQ